MSSPQTSRQHARNLILNRAKTAPATRISGGFSVADDGAGLYFGIELNDVSDAVVAGLDPRVAGHHPPAS
jgi:hypothetical protein